MKKVNKFLLLFSSFFLLASCQGNTSDPGKKEDSSVKETRTVKFESNGGSTYADVVTENGERVRLPIPTRNGYEFLGWYDNPDFSGNVYEGVYTPTSASITFYAKWQLEGGKITIHFEDASIEDLILDSAGKITLPAAEKYGYHFDGWKVSETSTDLIVGEYDAQSSITLYAQFHKVSYLYLYVNYSSEHTRLEYEPGASVELSTLPTPEDFIVGDRHCPFIKWVDEKTGEDVASTLVLNEEDNCLKAVYDTAGIPMKVLLEEVEEGVYETKGKGIKPFYDDGTNVGVWSLTVGAPKTLGGATGLAFRMSSSGHDYSFEEAGTSYISCTFSASSGAIQVGKIVNGVWGVVKTMALNTLPTSYQEKFNSINYVEVDLTVVSTETSFSIYLDGEKIYTNSDSSLLSQFSGTGFGYRGSAKGYTITNLNFTKGKSIKVDTNGGLPMDDVFYWDGAKEISLPDAVTNEPNKVFDAWYYDKACTQKVDLSSLVVTDETILYAGYRLPKNKSIVDKGSGTYELSAKSAGIVADATDYAKYSVEGDLTFKKGGGGSFGFIIRSNITSDDSYESGNTFVACQMLPNNGGFQFSNYLNGFHHLGGLASTKAGTTVKSPINTIATYLPDAWVTEYNSTASGSEVTVNLKLIDLGTSLEIYIEGEKAFTTDATPFNGMVAKGVGFKTSQANVKCTNFKVSEIA